MTIGSAWTAARARRWLRGALAGNEPRLLGKPTIMISGGRLIIGDRLHLASRPVASHLAVGPDAVLEIGSDVAIGHGAAIAAFQNIRIGSGTHIGPFVIIMDSNFHGSADDQSVQHDTRPVSIGDGCRIGSRVTITRGASIGDGAEILAGSVVSSAIPPGACAAGARARIIGRAGSTAARWDGVAAPLPDMFAAALELDSAPDLDSSPIPSQQWTDAGIRRLLSAVEGRFAVVLEHAALRRLRTFEEVAAVIQGAVQERGR